MKKRQVNSPRTPVYRNTGFELYDPEITASAFKTDTDNAREPDLYIYSRYRNPTVEAAEEEIMRVENCKWALLTQTGMSAIDTAVSVFQKGKETRPLIFFTEIYGGTISYIDSILRKRRGAEVITFAPANGKYNLEEFEKLLIGVKPEFIYAETISNPLLIVTDILRIIEISHRHNCRVIIDNTFASPFLFRPLSHGADIVVHSATKYLSGHGNLTAGVICGNDQGIMKEAVEYRKFIGHMISPDDAYRLNTQIKTFRLRFSKQCENALLLADLFNREKTIGKVFFPGLKDHSTHLEALKLFGDKYFGAMITIDFAGPTDTEKRNKRDSFIKNVSNHIKLIPTLGDPQTILMPVESVWGAKYPEPGMVRISVGYEEWEDLKTTVTNGLNDLSS